MAPSSVPPAEPLRWRARIVSALVLIPVGVIAIGVGLPVLGPLAALLVAVMVWEWTRLVVPGVTPIDWGSLAALAALATLIGWLESGPAALMALVIGLGGWLALRGGRVRLPGWVIGGVVLLTLAGLGVLLMRGRPAGLAETALAFILVWAVDSAAFLVGRAWGGPRLAPSISPNKTWAGFLAGIVAGMMAAAAVGAAFGRTDLGRLLLWGLVLAIVTQIGDMAESYAKRRFGVKDVSGLIPGHGGVLDRLDGMIAVVLFLALMTELGVSP